MKLLTNKKIKFIILPLILVAGIFIFGSRVLAAYTFGDWAGVVVGGLIGVIISALGLILILLVKGLMVIASFQTFIGAAAVVQGWVIVRDLCNMFFVVVLLIISFGTILHLEEYSYKKWLPKLILMAVLINFSKTICGILIDVSQVVMLSFVNAFKDVGGAYLLDNLGISKILTFAKDNKSTDFWTIIGAYVLGLIYIVIAIVVIAAMLAMLAMRVVMIWIYVVLSPLAYLLSAFPGGSKYASQWWSQFTQNLIVGPVLAFFIWLSFAALQQGGPVPVTKDQNAASAQEAAYYLGSSTSTPVAATQASTPEALINFVIAIGMLIGGLKITQEIGGVAAGVAGKVSSTGFNYLKKKGTDAGKWAVKSAKNRFGDIRDATSEAIGIDLNFVEGHKRKIQQQEKNREKTRTKIRKNTLEKATKGETWAGRKMALFSTGDVAYQNIKDGKFFKGGSPERAKEALAKIKEQGDQKKAAQNKITDLNIGANRILTVEELQVNQAKVAKLDAANDNLAAKKKEILNDKDYQKLTEEKEGGFISAKDDEKLNDFNRSIEGIDRTVKDNKSAADNLRQDPSQKVGIDQFKEDRQTALKLEAANEKLGEKRNEIISDPKYQELLHKEEIQRLKPEEKKELEEKRTEAEKIEDTMEKNAGDVAEFRHQYVEVDNDEEKKEIILGNKQSIDDEQQKVGSIEKEIIKFGDVLRKNKLSEVESARADINATREAEANKSIANFSNPDQLVSIFKEAVEQKDEALIAACYKKLAKTSNYNEIHRDLGLGTGYEGMINMKKYLQEDAGMTKQDAGGLIAEVGEICKTVNHFEAFGAMTMNKAGEWEETGKDQQEANILSEKSKIQVQLYMRNSNRLGNGSYRTGQDHTADNWDISRSTIALWASKDKAYADEMIKTGNINAIQFIGANQKNLKRLRDSGATEVARVIEDLCRKTVADVSNPLQTIRDTKMS